MEAGGTEAGAAGGERAPGARLGRRAPDPRCGRRLGERAARRPPGRLAVPVPQRLLPRRGRHRGHHRRAASRRPRALPGRDRARHRMGAGHAEHERRLGLVRRRQHPPLSERHPVRRSRRPARPADRRRHRALLSMLAQQGYGRSHPAIARALDFLRREQEADGSWFGRWGTNYIYGTWSVLVRLERGRRGPCGGRCATRRRLAEVAPAGRRRLGRELRQLLARAAATRRCRARPRRPPGRCSA